LSHRKVARLFSNPEGQGYKDVVKNVKQRDTSKKLLAYCASPNFIPNGNTCQKKIS